MELIVVISIIAVIAVFTVPSASQILKGSTLTQASTILTDQIRLARDVAVTQNLKVEVRFYQYADPESVGETAGNPSTGQFRAVQIFSLQTVKKNGVDTEVTIPYDKVQLFPQGVIMNSSSTYSTLLNNPAVTQPIKGASDPANPSLPRGIGTNYNYYSFRFLPDGSTNLATTGLPWFLTIHNAADAGLSKTPPVPYNFFCIQVDPVSGTTKSYRPTAG